MGEGAVFLMGRSGGVFAEAAGWGMRGSRDW